MTSVLLVDDHSVVRAGLAALLGSAEHLDVVAEASDGLQGVELATRLRPDVVLMDLSMPVLDGVAATRRIVQEVPAAHVVVLTSFADRRHVAAAMAAGAVGYLVKDCDPHDIIAAVRSAARGSAPIDARAEQLLRSRPRCTSTAPARTAADAPAPLSAADAPAAPTAADAPAARAAADARAARPGGWRRLAAWRSRGR
jgi:DNA-binding NarL/FixJ family response regulator